MNLQYKTTQWKHSDERASLLIAPVYVQGVMNSDSVSLNVLVNK